MKILTEKGIREIISISLDDSNDDKFFIVAEWFEYTANGCFTVRKEPIAYFPIGNAMLFLQMIFFTIRIKRSSILLVKKRHLKIL